MTWWQWLPTVVAASALLILPGLALGLALGLRSVVALLGVATGLTTAHVSVASLLAHAVGAPWGVGAVSTVVLAGCAAAVVARRVAARRDATSPVAPSPWTRATAPALALALVALAGAGASFLWALGAPDVVSQSYDAVFHLNGLRWVYDVGNASPEALGAMTSCCAPSRYPSAWHALGALLMPLSLSPPAVANAISFAIVVMAWPAGVALLARQVSGDRLVAIAAAGLSPVFVGMPWTPLDWGVLWPFALGTALVAPGLAAWMSVLGSARHDVFGGRRVTALVVVLALAVGCAAAHPAAFLAAALLAVVLTVWRLGQGALAAARGRRWARAVLLLVLVPVLPLVAYQAAARIPGIGSVRRFDWPAVHTPSTALEQLLLGSHLGSPPLVGMTVLVVVGAAAVLRTPAGWLVPAYLVVGALEVLAAGYDTELAQLATGFWYNDRHRLLALLPVAGVPLAAVAVVWLASPDRWWVRDARGWERNLARVAPVALAASSVVVGVPAGAAEVADSHGGTPLEQQWVGEREQEFLAERLPALVPDDAVVAASPFTGGSLAYALSGQPVLFRHLNQRRTPEVTIVADWLKNVSTDPVVCRAVEATDVDYVYDDDRQPEGAGGYLGLRDLEGVPGVELVEREGPLSLWRVLPCDSGDA